MTRSLEEWTEILTQCRVKAATVAVWAPVFTDLIQDGTFSAGDADVAPFLAQTLVETQMLTKLNENLNYSPQRLMAIWPRRFPTMGDANCFAHSPEALANKVYGGRLGNDEDGDGWKYHGRGIPMITGKANYQAMSHLLGMDLVSEPERLEDPAVALTVGIHWWEKRIPDSILEDTKKVSEAVNGGDIGMSERVAMTDLVRSVIA